VRAAGLSLFQLPAFGKVGNRGLFLICTQYSSRFRVDPMRAGAGHADHSFIGVVAKIGRIASDPTLHVLPGVWPAIEERGHPEPFNGNGQDRSLF
jgi:hypothetical protein